MGPEDDARLPEWGIGLTDIVKRPTRGIHELARREFILGAKALEEKIARYQPHVVCFVGLTGYQICCEEKRGLGSRPGKFGGASAFVIPSTSPRNASYSLEQIVTAMRDLKKHIQTVKGEREPGAGS
jgi:TDG/mug DNA glycosylase family protein